MHHYTARTEVVVGDTREYPVALSPSRRRHAGSVAGENVRGAGGADVPHHATGDDHVAINIDGCTELQLDVVRLAVWQIMFTPKLLNLRPPRVWITWHVTVKDVHRAVAVRVLVLRADGDRVSINRAARAHQIGWMLVTHREPCAWCPIWRVRGAANEDVGATDVPGNGIIGVVYLRVLSIRADDDRVTADPDRVSKRRGPLVLLPIGVDDVQIPGRLHLLHLARPELPPPGPGGIIPRVDVDGAVQVADVRVVHHTVAVVVDARPRRADDDGISVDGDGSPEWTVIVVSMICVDGGVRARVGPG